MKPLLILIHFIWYIWWGGGVVFQLIFRFNVHFESMAVVNFILLTILISAWYPFCIYFGFAQKLW